MGCVVNGPGEAKDADIGIAGGDHCAVLFKHGKIIEKLPEDKIVDRLKEISKDIDWDETVLGGHTSEAISFMALLEIIAGKRNLNKLAYLVFNEMYI